LPLFAGCSDGRQPAQVSGQISLDGQPAAEVYVSFQPQTESSDVSADAMGSFGVTDEAGKYTLRLSDTQQPGALVGKHVVRLSDKRAASTADGGPSTGPKPRFPSRYADGSTTFDVPAAGTDQANFQLKSK
jgi:hypothetical protein